jgi:predicted O-methyltransferase YrrM
LWESLGFHLTPVHYYQPIPDTRFLRDELWQKDSAPVGIDMNDEKQLEFLSTLSSPFKNEYQAFPKDRTSIPHEYYYNNDTFSAQDAVVLYSMIRSYKPKRFYEIGSGLSTFLAAQAIRKNNEARTGDCEFVVFDPHPNATLKKGIPGLSRVVRQRVQDVPLDTFASLGEADILFIDSSHVLTIGNDVRYLYLDVLPRLNKSVIIHVHDIFWPQEYPKKWVSEQCIFWNEQYVLQAFLAFNRTFEILVAGNYLFSKYGTKFAEIVAPYSSDAGSSSLWMRRSK